MKLTEKDKAFLQTLRRLITKHELWAELTMDRPSYLVLKANYGEKIHKAFHMSRQGVRWRFDRIFNDIYVSAFETITFIESIFGTELRDDAIRISKERFKLRQEAARRGVEAADEYQSEAPGRPGTESQGESP